MPGVKRESFPGVNLMLTYLSSLAWNETRPLLLVVDDNVKFFERGSIDLDVDINIREPHLGRNKWFVRLSKESRSSARGTQELVVANKEKAERLGVYGFWATLNAAGHEKRDCHAGDA